jgi:tetratricopeptide (TPR) repeat protein
MLMNRRERRAAAKGSRTTRHTPAGSTPAALYEEGLQHFFAGRYLETQVCCQKALALAPDHADTLHLAGLLALSGGQYDHAIEWISRAVRQQPKTDYLTNLGTALLKQGRREEALAAFDKAVQLKPDDASLWKNLGDALSCLGRSEEAILTYQHALKLNPCHWDAAYRAGLLLHESGRIDEALAFFDLHERMPADHGLKFMMRAHAMSARNRFEEALSDIKRAHTLEPANAEICNHMGMFLVRLGREEEALLRFDQALSLEPGFPSAMSNKAFALNHLRRFAEALAIYERLKAIDPNGSQTMFRMSLVHLLTGNFEAGWAEREARWNVPNQPLARFNFAQPKWLGQEPLEGKTILVFEDEGMGDTIQFARYVPMLAARGAQVILYVNDPVVPLLTGMSGVSQCIPKSVEALPAFDLYCPICSLPLAFETRLDTIPSGMGYLPQPQEGRRQIWEARLCDRLGATRKLRVGLVWSGNPKHTNDRNRSIPLPMLLPLLDVDADFISLQKDPRPDDRGVLEQSGIADMTAQLIDFTETAALISQLDLVITVDTSVAHLAGALGRPTWIMLPYLPDWRWLLDRDDSPWYPTVRLFRQDAARDYGRVIDRMRDALLARTSR